MPVWTEVPGQSRDQNGGQVRVWGSCADLRSVGPEGRFLVVQLDGLGIEVDGGRPVVGSKGFVALVLEFGGLRLRGRHAVWVLGAISAAGDLCGVPREQ